LGSGGFVGSKPRKVVGLTVVSGMGRWGDVRNLWVY
jgi:hypothetical protein